MLLLLSMYFSAVTLCSAFEWRIVGGHQAILGQFPYQASLRYSGQHICGGTILNEYWILTAAHCIAGLPGHLSIQVGSIELHFGGPPYGISLAIYHPKYDPNVIQNDIALIKTTTPIQFNNNTQPIPLNEDNIPAGETLTLSGWGRTGLPGEISEFLQYIDLKSISNNDCKMSMSDVTNLQLCTFTKKGEGACRGDSGGPLVYKGKIAGIVSYGKPCAAGFPDVFTRISKYVDWIQGVIKYN